ncbi:MAG: YpsA SLOG family protein [Limnohabitans sp.]|uniref:YpsA SLOG family protein n=1 Tax=Limnohabitans sp. TaxID=1907725 RepID=UPI003918E86B
MGGNELTQRLANKLIKPLILFGIEQPWSGQIESTQAWLHTKLIRVLNVSGSIESSIPASTQ